MPRNIAQIKRALTSVSYNLVDLEEYIDIVAIDDQVASLETLVEQAKEAQAEADDEQEVDDSDDEEED